MMIVKLSDLKKAISLASMFRAKKSTIEWSTGILISAKDDDHITLSGTNFEEAARIHIEASSPFVKWRFPVAVDAVNLKKLLEVIPADDFGNVNLEFDRLKRKLIIHTVYLDAQIDEVDISFSLACLSKEKSKEMTEFINDFFGVGNPTSESSNPLLFQHVRDLIFCASHDEAHPALQTVKFGEYIAACDGFRIGMVSGQNLFSGMIDAELLRKTIRVFKNSPRITILDNGKFIFCDDTAEVCSKFFEGNFPDVEAIYPKSSKLVFSLDKQYLYRALLMADRVNDLECSSSIVIFELCEKEEQKYTTTVRSNNEYDNEIYSSMEIPLELIRRADGFELPFRIAFNPRMLLPIVEHIHSQVVCFEMSSKNVAVLVRPEQADDPLKYVVMPMHLG